MQIGVVGCGVVGLTTALGLQSEYRNAQISIVADKFLSETVSDVAAGIFRPGPSFSGPTLEITRKWIADAFHYWNEFSKKAEGSKAGICELSGYIFSTRSPHIVRNHFLEKILPLYRSATKDELNLCPGGWKYGSFFTTTLTDCGIFLPWAMEKFKQNGGKIIQDRITNLKELQGLFDLIVNCTGLEAKYLCDDHKLVPIRGQVLKVSAPWVKTAFFADYDTYIIPGFNEVTLGGCRNFDSYDTDISRHDSAAIWERCTALVPSLKKAPIVRQRVGLRPHRDPVRVEIEFIETGKGILKVVHNYGHGGYGVTVAPGTAKYAVQLVSDVISGGSKL